MAIRMNPELAAILAAKTTKLDQLTALNTALTATKRIKAKRAAGGSTLQSDVWATGTLFRDAALLGPLTFSGATVTGVGATSNLTTSTAADLSTGVSVMRIEGGGHWLEGTIGLSGSGADFTIPTNPTVNNSFAVAANFVLRGSANLVDGTVDNVPPACSVAVPSGTVTTAGSFTLTATATDNIGVTKVEFYRDGTLLGSKTAAPWTFNDNLTTALNGTRAFTVKAYDAAGNVTTSAAVNVVVNIASAPSGGGNAVAVGSTITTFSVTNTSGSTALNVPFTLGHSFVQGNLPTSGAGVSLKLADNSVLQSQFDVKANHPDLSVRHAIISGVIPSMAAGEVKTITMVRRDASNDTAPTTPTLSSFVTAGLEATVSIASGGIIYNAKLSDFAASASLKWLTGSVANEWLITAPLKDNVGNEHPYLHSRMYVRTYNNLNKAKIDITIENSWVIPDPVSVSGGSAWINNNPNNVTYDLTITVPGDPGFTQTGLLHYNRGRLARTFWWNGASPAHVKHNTAYIINSKAVPNYDQTKGNSSSVIAGYVTKFAANSAPMKPGVMQAAMGGTGGRPDIGINPGWCVNWLLTGDKDAKAVSVGTSMQGGSFSVYYRNKATDAFVDIRQYPRACISTGSSSDDLNSITGKHEKFPAMATSSGNANVPNDAHHPAMSYIPYLLTGDYVHLENHQAWNEWLVYQLNPAYRKFEKGAVYHGQVRAMAWMIRTVAQTAYISPEGDPIKQRSIDALNYTLDFLNTTHSNSTDPTTGNVFGIVHSTENNALLYPSMTNSAVLNVGASTFQDDFVTQSIGMCDELGFTKARTFLNWKAKCPVGRMLSPDFCWVLGLPYSMDLRASSTSFLFTTWKQVYQATIDSRLQATTCNTQAMADACTLVFGDYGAYVPGQMPKYASQDDGYASTAQPAMAYVATSDHPQGAACWAQFNGRAVKPTYDNPQFAIIPRT